MPYVDRYKKDSDIKDKQWPDKFGFQIRFKRYLCNKDEFKEHVDVGDYDSAILFSILFISTDNHGGQTSLSEYNKVV